MPSVSLQNQKDSTLRAKLFAIYKNIGGHTAAEIKQTKALIATLDRQALIAGIKGTTQSQGQTRTQTQTMAQVRMQPQTVAQVKAQIKAQAQAQRTSRKSRKSRKSQTRVSVKGGKAASTTIPKALRTRVHQLERAISAGTLAARQTRGGLKLTSAAVLKAPKGFKQIDNRTRYEQFLAAYEDIRVTKKSLKTHSVKKTSGGTKTQTRIQTQTKTQAQKPKSQTSAKKQTVKKTTRKSIKNIYKQVAGQKHPYMVRKSKKIPTRVGAVPGQGAIPFNRLTLVEQQKIVAFLNSKEGQKLREKGAPRKVKFQEVKRQSKKKGAANR